MIDRNRTQRGVLVLSLALQVLAGGAIAEGLEVEGEIGGDYVGRSGSKSKLLEDHNLQSGAEASVRIDQELSDDQSLSVEGFGQSGEEQGYLRGEYGKLGRYNVLIDVESWREYYNTRTGAPPIASSGVPIDGNFFPFDDDSRDVFGDGRPSTRWTTTGASFNFQPDQLFRDIYGDFHYRSVNGEQTLEKSGTLLDPLDLVPGSGPGTVAFLYPGRQNVDYDTFSGSLGGRAFLGGLNWQTDGSYTYNELDSDAREANLAADLPSSELEVFKQDSDVQVAKWDLAGSRHFGPDVYVYGAGLFSYERSDPEPSQVVQDGIGAGASRIKTRDSGDNSDITRFAPALSLGSVFQPASNVVVTLDARARGTIQDGDLTERRDESLFLFGDVGTVRNDVDRDGASAVGRMTADWRLCRSVSIRTEARYQYRWQDVDSRRDFDFVAAEAPEIEKYQTRRNRIEAGPSVRWRLKRGRSIEAGYQFTYEDMDTDISTLSNNLILGDYDLHQHKVYLKATGRLVKNLSGSLRFQYVNERRDMDAPFTDPVGFVVPSSGEVEWQVWNVTPMLTYSPHKHWSLYTSVSVGQRQLDIIDQGATPANVGEFADFEYDALTETVAAGASYRPSDAWSASTSYSFYHSGDSVQNHGHNVSVSGDYKVADAWSIRGQFRYLNYRLADTDVNDYDAYIPYLGVVGHF